MSTSAIEPMSPWNEGRPAAVVQRPASVLTPELRNDSVHSIPRADRPAEGGRAAPTTVPAPQTPSSAVTSERLSSAGVLEEYFECYIEALEGDELRLRTFSSKGEEAIATMPVAAVPPGERPYIELGAPLRVAIFRSQDGKQTRREQQVRLLRPSQWKAPLSEEGRQAIVDHYERRLRSIVQKEG